MIRDSDVLATLPPLPCESDSLWTDLNRSIERLVPKVLVLDDDPTGVQTVHGVPVYTEWTTRALIEAIGEGSRVVYFLTNSRALQPGETVALHEEYVDHLASALASPGVQLSMRDLVIISRSDSTLRGHYPLEVQTLRDRLGLHGVVYSGEVIVPAFFEGDRVTVGDTHYVHSNEELTPVADTEFAKDATFGYCRSDLREWIEERTKGEVRSRDVVSISIEELRDQRCTWCDRLLEAEGYQYVVVNAVCYEDLALFAQGMMALWSAGKRYIFRSAASWVRVIGGIAPRLLLKADDLTPGYGAGLIIVGSYVKKTTAQLEQLLTLPEVRALEFDVFRHDYECQADEIAHEIDRNLSRGFHTALFTSRQLWLPSDQGRSSGNVDGRVLGYSDASERRSDEALKINTHVSEGLVRVVRNLSKTPAFILAKGGITSSDIAVKGLGVKRAVVLGQVAPGIPAWRLGPEAKFSGIPYIVFPGNVGSESALREIVAGLIRWLDAGSHP